MGWRFRKSVGILPGVRVNISKSGLSTSVGERGATVNIGARGARGSVGLPGSGLSYSRRLGGGGGPRWRWMAWALPLLGLLFAAGNWAVKHIGAAHSGVASGQNCACGTATCTGPRGGHYCLTPEGRKRYVR